MAFSCRERRKDCLKNIDLARAAVNCNAGLGEHAWLPTTS
jgi:hypothetical protein